MISLIETLNYKCLRYIHRPLGAFHVLVGPNASGKTTFLDVVSFLSKLTTEGLEAAVDERTKNFYDLTWGRRGEPIELAIEAELPAELNTHFKDGEYNTIRYEVKCGLSEADELAIFDEKVMLKTGPEHARKRISSLFPCAGEPPKTILREPRKTWHLVVKKNPDGKDEFHPEMPLEKEIGLEWSIPLHLGTRKSALGNLFEDSNLFPASLWLKQLLTEGIQSVVLNSMLIRKASPPGKGKTFRTDGSNLPWVIEHLQASEPQKFRDWIAHVQTALPDVENIKTIERPEDRHRYMVVCYKNGLEAPSWIVSDGTLRFLALTLPAYLPGFKGVYLIEEPENGIHPRAVQSAFDSLSSVYNAQILIATHSPVILNAVDPEDVLCFAKTPEGVTDIVSGSEHPNLKDWQRETSLGTLFAGGVLG